MLGEDETAAKNRIVLICSSCRLVNGQAPPGTKRLSEVGMWKCMGCGATNGEVDEGKRIVKEVLGTDNTQAKNSTPPEDTTDGDSSDVVEVGREDGDASERDRDDEKQSKPETASEEKHKKSRGRN